VKKFVIIDGNSIVHRSYHALPKTFTSQDGRLTNAVYGFTTILLGILEIERPDYIAVAFDMKGPTFRHAEMADYKGTRVKTDDELIAQFPLVREVLESFSIPIFEKAGLEADDYLGIVSAELAGEDDLMTLIVTSDKDALQLVGERVLVVAPVSGYTKVMRYDREAVKGKMGVWPEQVADYKGLCGDSSDNIPGVPGVGPVSAVKLLEKFGDLDGIYSHLDEVEPAGLREKLRTGEESARLSKRVATILTEDGESGFSLAKCAVHAFDISAVRRVFDELSFRRPMGRVEALEKVWAVRRAEEVQGSLF